MAEEYSIVYMYHILFICSSVDGHSGCFHVLAIVNSAEMSTKVHTFFKLWFSPDVYPGVGLLDHMVALSLVFKEPPILFSIEVVRIYIPTVSIGGLLFSTPSPAFAVCRLFDDGHSDCFEVILHCSFEFHFSDN